MAGRTREARQDELIDRLAEFRNARARTSFLRRHNQLWEPAVVERLYARVVRLARIDLQRTDRLAQAATWVAEKIDDAGCRAQSLRATGHVRFIRGKYNEALEHYDTAVKLFGRGGTSTWRTLNGALQSLISLGRYKEALASARRARLIFERHGVALGLARLDSNVGNILCRQDRFDEALALYERAYEQLSGKGEPPDVALCEHRPSVTAT